MLAYLFSALTATAVLMGWTIVGVLIATLITVAIGYKRMGRWIDVQHATEEAMTALGGHPLGLAALQAKCYEGAKAKGWHAKPVPVPTRLMLMVCEVAEAMEEYRKGYSAAHVYYGPDGKPEGIAIELADTLIRILDFAGVEGIDMEAAVLTKLAYNTTRSHRHGGKIA